MTEDEATIIVQVQPNASQNRVVRFDDGIWYLKIAAPPLKGRANQELRQFLSGILGINRSHLAVVKGTTSKRKVIAITGLTQDRVTEKLHTKSTGK